MKLLDSIYKFLLGDDTDVPFDDLEEDVVEPETQKPVLRLVTDYDAA